MSGKVKDPAKRRRDAGRKVTFGVIEDVVSAAHSRYGDLAARLRRVPGYMTLALILVLFLAAPGRYEADDGDRGVMRRRWTPKLTGEIAALSNLATETVIRALRWWVERGWLRLDGDMLCAAGPLAESIRETNVTRAELGADAPADYRRTFAHLDVPALMAALDSNADATDQQRACSTARLVAILNAVAGGSRGHHTMPQRTIGAVLRIAASTVSYTMSTLKDLAGLATGRHRYSTDAGVPRAAVALHLPDTEQLRMSEETAMSAGTTLTP